jgi:hypothetical protein
MYIRTIGVGISGSGCERSGRFTFVNIVDALRSFLACPAGGIPGTDPEDPGAEVVGAAREACRTWAPAGKGGSWAETASRVLCWSCVWIRVIKVDLFPFLLGGPLVAQ